MTPIELHKFHMVRMKVIYALTWVLLLVSIGLGISAILKTLGVPCE